MGLKCRVSYSPTGTATAYNEDGSISALYTALLSRYNGNQSSALEAWAVAQTEEFKDEFPGATVTANGVLKYLDTVSSEGVKLDPSERMEMKSFLSTSKYDSLSALYNDLVKVFKPNGTFELNVRAAEQTGLYTEQELKELDENTLNDLLIKIEGQLRLFDIEVPGNLNSEMEYVDTSSKTVLGTFKRMTQDEVDAEILSVVDPTMTEEEILYEINNLPYNELSERLEQDDAFREDFISRIQNLTLVPQLNFDGEVLTTEITAFEDTVRNTVPIGANTAPILATIRILEDMTSLGWENTQAVAGVLEDLSVEFLEFNMDIIGLEKLAAQPTDVMELLLIAEETLSNPTKANVKEFSEVKQRLLPDTRQKRFELLDTEMRNYTIISLYTAKTDSELFDKGLIKVGDNLYHKVKKEDKTALYEFLYEMYVDGKIDIPQELKLAGNKKDAANKIDVLKDLEKFINTRETNLIVEDNEMLSLYQVAFNHKPVNITRPAEKVSKILPLMEEAEYLRGEFVSDFYNYMLREKKKNSAVYRDVLSKFAITSADITLVDTLDSIDGIELESELRDYIRIRRDNTMDHLLGTETLSVAHPDFLAINFPETVKDYESEKITEGPYVVVPKGQGDYIKIDGEIHRKTLSNNRSDLFIRIATSPGSLYLNNSLNFEFDRESAQEFLDSVDTVGQTTTLSNVIEMFSAAKHENKVTPIKEDQAKQTTILVTKYLQENINTNINVLSKEQMERELLSRKQLNYSVTTRQEALGNFLKALSGIAKIERSPINSSELFYNDDVVIELSTAVEIENINSVSLQSILSMNRGKGQARKALSGIVSIADQLSMEMTLDAKPFGNVEGRLDVSELVDLYESHGFEVDMDSYGGEFNSKAEMIEYAEENSEGVPMKRKPKNLKSTISVSDVRTKKAKGDRGEFDGEHDIFVDGNPIATMAYYKDSWGGGWHILYANYSFQELHKEYLGTNKKEALEELVERYNNRTLPDLPSGIEYLSREDKVYGFYDTQTGEIYLTEEFLSSESLVHELYHAYKPMLKEQTAKGNKSAKKALDRMRESAVQLLGGEAVVEEMYVRRGTPQTTVVPTSSVVDVVGKPGVKKIENQNSTLFFKERVSPFGEVTGELELDLIETPKGKRDKGSARSLMVDFLDYSDSIGKDVYLFASPRDKETTTEQLIAFYESVGFKSVDSFLPEEMIRKAAPKKGAGLNFLYVDEGLLSNDLNFSVVGENANLRQDESRRLAQAKDMLKEGKSPSDVELATGWLFQNGDWKHFSREVVESILINPEAVTKIDQEQNLEDVINKDNKIFEFYPELRQQKVIFYEGERGEMGKTTPDQRIMVNVRRSTDTVDIGEHFRGLRGTDTGVSQEVSYILTLLHELQHVIQNKEGFSRGGTVNTIIYEAQRISGTDSNKLGEIRDAVNKKLTEDISEKDRSVLEVASVVIGDRINMDMSSSVLAYLSLHGEVEARVVELAKYELEKEGSIVSSSLSDLTNKMATLSGMTQEDLLDVRTTKGQLSVDTTQVINRVAEVGTQEQYSEYLSNKFPTTVVPVLHKGMRNKSGHVHTTPGHSFFTADFSIADKWYKDSSGVKSFAVDTQSVETFRAPDGLTVSETRKAEEDFINNSKADVVILDTNDIGGRQLQYVVKKDVSPYELGTEQDLEGFRDFLQPNLNFQIVSEGGLLNGEDKTYLSEAKNLEANGTNSEVIYSKTGWFKTKEGKWLREINDLSLTDQEGLVQDLLNIEGEELFKPLSTYFSNTTLGERLVGKQAYLMVNIKEGNEYRIEGNGRSDQKYLTTEVEITLPRDISRQEKERVIRELFKDSSRGGVTTANRGQRQEGVSDRGGRATGLQNFDRTFEEVVNHELTHAVQNYEGRKVGNDPIEILKYYYRQNIKEIGRDKNYEQINKELSEIYEKGDFFKEVVVPMYENSVGEVEANLVGGRLYDKTSVPTIGEVFDIDLRDMVSDLRASVSQPLLQSGVYSPRPSETLEQYKERIIEEAEAIILQENSVEYFEKIAKENGLDEAQTKSFLDTVKKFIKDFSDWVIGQLGLNNVTPQQVAEMTNKQLYDTVTTSMLKGEFSKPFPTRDLTAELLRKSEDIFNNQIKVLDLYTPSEEASIDQKIDECGG